MLGVSPDTVRRWARQGRLGVMRPSGEFNFEHAELERWAAAQGLQLRRPGAYSSRILVTDPGAQPLATALGRGTVLHEVAGATPSEVLFNLVERALLPESVDREGLVSQLEAREALASTGLGDGVALPHPRTPSATFVSEPTVVIAMLEHEVDWRAIDGQPVHTAILLLSPSPQLHLQVLSRLAFLLREERFLELLRTRAEADTVRAAVIELEPAEG